MVPIFYGELVANFTVGQGTSGIGAQPKPVFQLRLGPLHYSTMPPASMKDNMDPVTTLLPLFGEKKAFLGSFLAPPVEPSGGGGRQARRTTKIKDFWTHSKS